MLLLFLHLALHAQVLLPHSVLLVALSDHGDLLGLLLGFFDFLPRLLFFQLQKRYSVG